MICPICKNEIKFGTYCTICSGDMQIYRKIQSVSNQYYNQGLERAKVRNLTGAIDSLKNSLKLNKYHTEARNLLGLIYFEVGEIVRALSQWLISKHLQSEDNPLADYYINFAQDNQTKLQSISETIKKYNQALQYANQGSEDLAIIQLRKVISMNPHYVNAHLLVALLYIHEKEVDKAVKSLRKVLEVDKNNTMALSYLTELGSKDSEPIMKKNEIQVSSERQIFKSELPDMPVMASGKEYAKISQSSYGMQFILVALGVAIGMSILWFLVLPNQLKQLRDENNSLKSQQSGELSNKEVKISSLEQENLNLEKAMKTLEQQVREFGQNGSMGSLLKATKLYFNGSNVDAGIALCDIKKSNLKPPSAVDLYDLLFDKTAEAAFTSVYNDGYRDYNNRNYKEAIKNLEKAIKLKKDNLNSLIFLAKSYEGNNNPARALVYYEKILDNPSFANTNSARDAETAVERLRDGESADNDTE